MAHDCSGESSVREQLQHALANTKHTRSFATGGFLLSADLIDVKLSVRGVGQISLPLTRADARSLIEVSQQSHAEDVQSPLIVTGSRNLWDMDAWRVKLPSRWDELLDEAVKKTKEALHTAPDVK
jgi:hypothetical protein